MSERKYEHKVYGVGTTTASSVDYSTLELRVVHQLMEGYMAAKKQYEFSLSGKGKLWLSGRAAYMPTPAKGYTPIQRKITLSVYAKVQGGTPTSMGQSIRTWDELMDRAEVPANTPQGEQEQRMLFMMEMISVREGLLYQMRDKISTRPPLKPNALSGAKVPLTDDVLSEASRDMLAESMKAEYCWQDVNMIQKLYAK